MGGEGETQVFRVPLPNATQIPTVNMFKNILPDLTLGLFLIYRDSNFIWFNLITLGIPSTTYYL